MTPVYAFMMIYSLILTIFLANNCHKIIRFRMTHHYWHVDNIEGTLLDDRFSLTIFGLSALLFSTLAITFFLAISYL